MPERRNPFVLVRNRPMVTHEPDRTGQYTPEFPDVDWVGFTNQGGARVAADFQWNSNPKEEQERASAG
jgi:hypothetical protein